MEQKLRTDMRQILDAAIAACLPDAAVRRALDCAMLSGRVHIIAIGKAAFSMAHAAYDALGEECIAGGVVITKYAHAKGSIGKLTIFEAGHPVLDENGIRATEAALREVESLTEQDTVVFLVSGGGSALFEKPLIPLDELQDINRQLLASGASIMEINTIRKRLSTVKGGRFAKLCAPARVVSIVLSDIIGDPLDAIASGPAYPDASTSEEAVAIAKRYGLALSEKTRQLLAEETVKSLDNVETYVNGSVRELCRAAAGEASRLGYAPMILTTELDCEAREAGRFLGAIARAHRDTAKPLAFIAGGETVVHLTGTGLGGRNQELALAAAEGIAGQGNICIASIGSDGTDGPTDAAGGIVTGSTRGCLLDEGLSISAVLQDNDAYHALMRCNGLVMTGPTGTNVNDVSVVLIGADMAKQA